MDWDAAIERNRVALVRILAMLVAMAERGLGRRFPVFGRDGVAMPGPADGAKGNPFSALHLPRRLHRAVVRLLRPAEAAARRLIIVAARGIVLAAPPLRQRKPKLRRWRKTRPAGRPAAPAPRVPSLPLLDPLRFSSRHARRACGAVPRICVPGFSEPARFPPRSPGDPVSATRLALRLAALANALDDLPGQARRFARWRARLAAGRVRRLGPLRPGRPPGSRRRRDHPVYEVLNVLHGLAFWVLEEPDTS